MRYVRAKCAQDDESLSYRVYVTEALRMQGQNKYPARSWLDIINPKPRDERSGDEIVMDLFHRMQIGGE